MKNAAKNIKTADERISFSSLRHILGPIFKRYRFRLAIGFAALLLVDMMQLFIPKIMQHAINGISGGTITESGLFSTGTLIIALAVGIVLLRFLWRVLIVGFSRLLERRLRDDIFNHLLGMDLAFFSRYSTGDLMAHSSNDLNAVQMACGMGLVAAVDSVVMSLAAMGFMATIDVKLTCIALLPLPLLAIATRHLSARLHLYFSRVQQNFARLTEFSRSTLLSIGLIKAWTMEEFQTRYFHRLGKSYMASNMDVARIQGIITPLSALTGSVGMLLVLYVGGRLVISGSINIGGFIAFIAYLYMLIWPMIAIGWVTNLMQRGLTSLGRVEKILQSRPQLPDPPLPAGTTLHGREFRLVNASLTLGEAQVLDAVNLTFGPGTHGITGRTGSGKSTLCRLLARLHPVGNGMLHFDGFDVNTLPLAAVREHIAWAGQEPVLFSDTIRNNIAFGRPDASLEEIRHAARMAAVDNEILALASGYDTLIGERGMKLSGGQRQRVSLARALLCRRPILIIDDGLSAIDTATEYEIFSHLRQGGHRIIIFVSNRIKMLSMMDEVHILDEGSLVHSGSHKELLATSSFYRAMYDKQMRENADA
ncbi:MAG: ABC transporter ATP-binding protein/permease [Desulforhopalus sp.]|nr:ABC transporter ATP-binding protein/permease [Desulforhopalus sp.]